AVETRTDRREIVVCGSGTDRARSTGLLHLTSVDEAEEHRRSWRRRLRPTLVVIDAAISGGEQDWTNDLITALEPHSIWGVADAVDQIPDEGDWVLRLVPMTAGHDRRAHQRVGESSAVEVGAEGDLAAGRIIDLSESGMRCVVRPHRSLEVGDEIVVVFVLD